MIFLTVHLHPITRVYMGLSLVSSATVVRVSITLRSQEGVCSGHLIGQASQVTSWGEGAFGNAVSLSTPGVT